MPDLLVVAGEASGDRAAAAVVSALASRTQVHSFGLGGAAMSSVGVDLVADLRDITALGVSSVLRRGGAIAATYFRLIRAVEERKPVAALLVNYTEFNTKLARYLHARGVRVLWYGAPQIWAWRPGRAEPLRPHVDRMAVMLPFEEKLWRARGFDAHYVGHPAHEVDHLTREAARESLRMTPFAPAIALLPGSRPHEVHRLLDPMLEAFELLRHDRASIDGRVLLAASLDAETRANAAEKAERLEIEAYDVDARVGAAPSLRAFDAALCASGTAALEAALARAVPVVIYQVDPLTEVVARSLVSTKQVALPNVLLGREAFPELLQRDVRPRRIAEALAKVLDNRKELLRTCDEVERTLGGYRSPAEEVARMLRPWLGLGS